MKRIVQVVSLLLLAAFPAFASGGAMSLIPADAVSVGVVKLAELRASPLSSTLFDHTDKLSTDGDARKFLEEAGLQPAKDVDLLVVSTSPRTALGSEADVLVAAEGRFNVERLTRALVSRGAVKKNGYLVLPESKRGPNGESGAVAFPEANLALMGNETAVSEALASRAAGGTAFLTASGLGRELARVDTNASAWAIFDVARAQRLAHVPRVSPHANGGQALQGALTKMATVALWATDTGDSLKLGGLGVSHDAETLQLVEDTVRGALAALRLAVQDKEPALVSALRKFNVARNDDSVSISGTISADILRSLAAKKQALK
jgi:hypothetical protein